MVHHQTKKKSYLIPSLFFVFVSFLGISFSFEKQTNAQIFIATTSVNISICGDGIVDSFEECDVPGETGGYGSSIATRQCNAVCEYGPYCGDAVVQSIHSEQCDDGNNNSGDFCSNICQAETITTPSGGGGSGGGNFAPGSFTLPANSQVSITGKAYPNADVSILKDGKVIGVVKADNKADFFFSSSNVSAGTATFGFWAEDAKKLRSIAFNTTFQVVQGAVTTIQGVFLPPTISVDKRSVKKGDTVIISGTSVPEVTVKTVVNSETEVINTLKTDESGAWTLPFNTSVLEEDAHTAKALFQILSGGILRESSFSQAVSFFVGDRVQGATSSADLNKDTKVNLIDFSILIFNWGKPNAVVGDLNFDGKVNLADFSIMIFNWTG